LHNASCGALAIGKILATLPRISEAKEWIILKFSRLFQNSAEMITLFPAAGRLTVSL
jgi:hypothetical protein